MDDSKISNEEKEYYSLIKRVFDALAPFYDIICLLDVATGTGKQAFAFAKKGYEVIGIDISEAMLKVAKKKNIYENVKFEVADATKLPFADHIFDVSCISFALHDMPLSIRGKALQEMVRVTKTGGMLVIIDYALPKNRLGRFLFYHMIKLYEREYYIKFINSDLADLLRKTGIEIKEELPVMFGAGKFLKGITLNTPSRLF